MQDTKPPFRADHVGSLLRTTTLKEAREKRARGEISAAALSEVEDREIENVIRKQEDVGLKSITDGEFRRTSWNYDFLERLEGVESYVGERKIKFNAKGPQPRAVLLRVVGKLGGYTPHPMIEHFKFLKPHTKQTPKVTIPSPSSLHFRYGRDAVPESIYPAMEDFYRDLGRSSANRARLRRRRLPLSSARRGQLCLSVRSCIARDGHGAWEDPATLPAIYAGMINAAIADIPPDMTITMHLCRGNFRSSFVASGGYEPVAETLFNAINVHGYFMEYDSDRAGGFEPLRFAPKGKRVVLGLVTSKSGDLESRDDIKRRIDEAAKHIALDQLCLSPQCGYASTEEGNVLSEAEQWAKLRMIVEIAEEVWG
jgi:5-methyltetrahydropteroyltriglutamate--homocysteine methyltransferase